MLKVCNKCLQEKEVTFFPVRKNRKSGYYSICKSCKNEYRSKKYIIDKSENPINFWISRNINGVRWRAKKNSIEFNLDSDYIYNLILNQDKKCPYCECNLCFLNNRDDKVTSPSFDRLIPSIGYLKENVVVCCYRCNSIKNNATYDELNLIVNNLKNVINSRGIVLIKNPLL